MCRFYDFKLVDYGAEGTGGCLVILRYIVLVLLTVPGLPLFAEEPVFPVTPEIFIDDFDGAEGISFNARGQLFIGANNGIYLVEADGSHKRIADVHTHLGMARIGERDILAADFGPTNVFRDGPNSDGIVWRVTPEGEKRVVARGIADPNFVLMLNDGTFLVSDDGTDKIYRVSTHGEVSIWTSDVAYPNGLALSLDGQYLYAAQIFRQLPPDVIFDDRLWRIPVRDNEQAGEPELAVATGGSGLDGLAVDKLGRIYICDNQVGQLKRYDPATGELMLIAEGMSNIASAVFGEGDFDREAIYATTTFRGGGTIWKINVGVTGAPYFQ